MIKTTTHGTRRLGTKLLGRPPRNRRAGSRGNRISSSRFSPDSKNLKALSSQRADMKGNQPDPIQARENREALPKRWQRGHDPRRVHCRSDAIETSGERATTNSDETDKRNQPNASQPPASSTNSPPANSESLEIIEADVLHRTASIDSPGSPFKNLARSRSSLGRLNTVRGRQQQLLDLESHQKRSAIEKYKSTGDPTHFLPFLEPFISAEDGTDNKAGHEQWQWDEETERHWRAGGKATGTRIWAPVKESFI
ncbi:hypothetical protein QBC43DRAFT_338586 [Cladorrhinum sp. PSN259]|nr:hypothetical protein QBC43DRAFT_338586 [Cladorrhinum sp. PSN259]